MPGFFSGRQRRPSRPALPIAGGLHGEIDVFCRVVVNRSKTGDHMLPYLLYLQGRVGDGGGEHAFVATHRLQQARALSITACTLPPLRRRAGV